MDEKTIPVDETADVEGHGVHCNAPEDDVEGHSFREVAAGLVEDDVEGNRRRDY